MAQSQAVMHLNNNVRLLRVKNETVAVAQAGNTTLLEVQTEEFERLTVEAAVTGQALDAFVVQVKFHTDGSYVSIASAAGDYTSPTGLMIKASGDLTAQAASTSGWFILDTRGVFAVKVLASSGNVAGSTVSVYAGGL